jgi:mRNA interferase MazF
MADIRRTRKGTGLAWPKRGDIYLAALGPVAPAPTKTRPVLVIQNDTSNQYADSILVAPIASNIRRPLSPLHVVLPADASTGLTGPSMAVFSQVRPLDRNRLIKKLGAVSAPIQDQVNAALEAAFGLTAASTDPDEEPAPTITDAISRSSGDFRTGRYEG